VIDGDVVSGGEGGKCGEAGFIVGVREERDKDAAAGAEVVGGEGVERREWRRGVNDSEEAVTVGIYGDAEDGGVGGEGDVGDEGFDYAGVGDGGDDAAAEGADEEMLSAWVPREGFRVEVWRTEVDDVCISTENWAWAQAQ